MESPHIPVLLNEVLAAFSNLSDDFSGVILDCTLGYGGHSGAILRAFPNVRIIACDRDETAVEFCRAKFAGEERIRIIRGSFSNLISNLSADELASVRGILADIGVSSLQLDLSERGFSLNSDELDMRMDKRQSLSATDVVNTYSHGELAKIFREYGELKNASVLASKILAAREIAPIKSARALADIIGRAKVGGRGVNQAILAFQAIRIEVNRELGELEDLLAAVKNSALKNAIFCVIDFHSLEDKIVKNAFREWEKDCVCPPGVLKCVCGGGHAIGRMITKKPIVPSEAEIAANSRSSCAKMRIFRIER